MAEKLSPAEDRAARLSAALRENLKRRKAQARAGRDVVPDAGAAEEVAEGGQPDQ